MFLYEQVNLLVEELEKKHEEAVAAAKKEAKGRYAAMEKVRQDSECKAEEKTRVQEQEVKRLQEELTAAKEKEAEAKEEASAKL